MWILYGLILYLVLLGVWVGPSTSFPQKRDVKEVSVGETSHVDGDDGEVWYPVEGGGAEEREPPPPNYVHNHLTTELLEALRNVFFKWGYTYEEIPAPFGSLDPSRPFHVTPEFTSVLELLVEKLPTDLELPILNILRENGVTEINIPKGILDNSEEIRKIDEIIAKLESLPSQPNELAEEQKKGEEPEKMEVDGKYDESREATIYCETKSGPCTSTEESLGRVKGPSLTMKHPDLKIPSGKLFVPRPQTPVEDKAVLNDDKAKLTTLIKEVKEDVLEGQAGNSSKVNEEMSQIAEVVGEVESIAERNIKLVGESPCAPTPSSAQHSEKLDSLVKEIAALQAERLKRPAAVETKKPSLDEIEALIRDIEAHRRVPLQSQETQSFRQGDMKRIGDMMTEIENFRQAHQQPTIEKYENGEHLKALDALMTEIRNHQSNSHIQGYGNGVIRNKDLERIPDEIAAIRNLQMESMIQDSESQNSGKRDEDLGAIEEEIAAIRNHQMQPLIHDLQKGEKRNEHLGAIEEEIAAIRTNQMQPLIHDLQKGEKRNEHLGAIEAEIAAIRTHQMQPLIQDLQKGGKRNEDLGAIEEEIAAIRNHEMQPLIQDLQKGGKRKEDLGGIEEEIAAIRNHQMQPMIQDLQNGGKRNEDLGRIEEEIAAIRTHEMQPMIQALQKSERQHEDLRAIAARIAEIRTHQMQPLIQDLENGGREDEDLRTIEAQIAAIRNHQMRPLIEDLETSGKRDKDLKAMAAEITVIGNHQRKPGAQDLQTSGKPNKDLKAMEAEIAAIRTKQIEPHIQDFQKSEKSQEDLKAIEDKIAQIRPLGRDFENDNRGADILKSMDTLIRGMSGNEIDKLINEMENVKGQIPDDDREKVKEIDSLVTEIKKHQHVSHHPPSHNENVEQGKLNQIEFMIQDMQARASIPEKTFKEANSKPKLDELEAMVKEIRRQEVQGQSQQSAHVPRHGSREDELQKLNTLMNDIEKVGSVETAQVHSEHVPNLQEMDAMIEEMNAKYGVKKSLPEKHGRPHSELEMLDSIVKEIGQIAQQEEKNIEDASKADNRHEVEKIISQIQNIKSPGDDKRSVELNRIMDDLDRESTIERDLQLALDHMKHSETSGRTRDQFTDELKNIENSRTESVSTSLYQTPEEGKGIEKLVSQMHRLRNDKNAKEMEAKLREVGNDAKVETILKAMEGFPKMPDLHGQQSKEEEAGTAEMVGKHGHEVPGIENVSLDNGLPLRHLNVDTFNVADAQYLRRLKDLHKKIVKT